MEKVAPYGAYLGKGFKNQISFIYRYVFPKIFSEMQVFYLNLLTLKGVMLQRDNSKAPKKNIKGSEANDGI